MTKRAGHLSIFHALFIVLFLNLSTVQASDAGEKVFLWRVDAPQATAYVLGTIHMMKADMYPLDERIQSAFRKSDAYAMEFNIKEVASSQMSTMMKDVVYSGNDNIRSHVSRETLDLAMQRLEALGLPFQMMEKFKPWFLAVTVEMMAYGKLGFDPKYGIDNYFLQKAQGTKEIIELESFDSQMEIFRSMPDKEQEIFLIYALKEADDSKKNMDLLLNAWSNGDSSTMEKLIFEHSRDDARLFWLYEKLFYERNRNMANRIEKLLAGKGNYFVAVGAGHLVGKRGIIELLAQKGFAVRQQ